MLGDGLTDAADKGSYGVFSILEALNWSVLLLWWLIVMFESRGEGWDPKFCPALGSRASLFSASGPATLPPCELCWLPLPHALHTQGVTLPGPNHQDPGPGLELFLL